MGNMFSIGNQSNLDNARVGFRAAFMDALEALGEDPVEQLYNQVKSETNLEEWEWLGDLSGFEEWIGDRKMGDLEAFKMRIENKDWAKGFPVHQNQFADDKMGLFPAKVATLAQKCRRHRSDLMVKMLLNGFDGAAYPEVGNGLAYDNAFFFSDSHANGDNKLTTALSADSLEDAEELLKLQQTADGKDPLELMGTHLIVGPKNEFVARKLVSSETVPASGGNASESNVHRGRYEVIVSRRIRGAQDDYWFLADLSAPIKPMIFQLREDISTSAILGNKGGEGDSVPRFQRGQYWFGAEARYNVGYFAFQTIIGSQVA